MWLCWLIERAATPMASTGGAFDNSGTTSSGSTATVHGHRRGSAATGCSSVGSSTASTTANTTRHTDA